MILTCGRQQECRCCTAVLGDSEVLTVTAVGYVVPLEPASPAGLLLPHANVSQAVLRKCKLRFSPGWLRACFPDCVFLRAGCFRVAVCES